MFIYIGADHRGWQMKEFLKNVLVQQGYQPQDVGNKIIDENDEYDMALELVRKKYVKDKNYTSTKIASFLQRRGFSTSVIITICNNIHDKSV